MVVNQYVIVGYIGELILVEIGQVIELNSIFYLGFKDQDKLVMLVKGLDLIVDYGILWWILQLLFVLFKFLYSLVGNWGVVIILIIIIVKGVMYWLIKK